MVWEHDHRDHRGICVRLQTIGSSIGDGRDPNENRRAANGSTPAFVRGKAVTLPRRGNAPQRFKKSCNPADATKSCCIFSLKVKLSVGSVAHVKPEAPVPGEYAAKVTVVDRVVDAASGTFGVRRELSNHDLKLPAGLKCNVRFGKSKE